MPHEPLVRLPEEIALTRAEVALVLEALDEAELGVTSPLVRSQINVVKRIVIGKIWPELGDLLDDGR